MAGFEVTFYGRFWVTPEAVADGLLVGTETGVIPDLEGLGQGRDRTYPGNGPQPPQPLPEP
jgi:hypothetical protein